MSIAISVLLFVFLTAAVTFFGYSRYVRPSLIIDRLLQDKNQHQIESVDGDADGKPSALVSVFSALGTLLPIDALARKYLKRQLSSAGYRSDSAIAVFSGVRILSASVLLVVALIVREHITDVPILKIVIIIAGCAAGYYAPGLVLDRLIKRRRESIRMALPDALDLLVVCTEAGCALDLAILNVSRELRYVHPAICEEFSLVNLEIRAGSPRSDALRNLGERTGEEDLKKLVSVLIQTDRFGTSVTEALRTQSDFMRTRRRQQAEERAGKVGVKLVFPIFFFCLPSLLVVTAGPGLLQLFKNLLPAIKELH